MQVLNNLLMHWLTLQSRFLLKKSNTKKYYIGCFKVTYKGIIYAAKRIPTNV